MGGRTKADVFYMKTISLADQVTEISERKFLFYPVERSRLDKKPQLQGGTGYQVP